MKVLLFGNFDPNYSRNKIVRKALEKNGVQVRECNSRRRGIFKYLDLYKKYKSIEHHYDFIYVGFPGYQAAIFAKMICRGPIIFDAFSSLHDSQVFDRKVVAEKSFKGRYYKWLDTQACKSADKVIVDTKAQAEYFTREFGVPENKIFHLYVGSNEDSITPGKKKDPRFIVHFHGTNIPLQGIKYILNAARVLEREQIIFNLIGTKIIKKMSDDAPSNVNFFESVPYEKLGMFMAEADVCLGIFGKTSKAKRVIPNKVFEAAAAKRAIITGNTPAIKELFTDKENVLLCNVADSHDLADKIRILQRDGQLKEKLADNAHEIFKNKLTAKHLGKDLLRIINA